MTKLNDKVNRLKSVLHKKDEVRNLLKEELKVQKENNVKLETENHQSVMNVRKYLKWRNIRPNSLMIKIKKLVN